MNGVVSLLPQPQYGEVEAVWAEIDRVCGSRGIYVTPYPHFSYQIAPQYAANRLEDALRAVAAGTAPFRVRTSGLGVFTGASPVLYIPVVRDPQLAAFHRALWDATVSMGTALSEFYAPERWMPHITVAYGDLTPDRLSDAARLLAAREFNWEFTVDHVAFIHDATGRQILRSRFDFGAAEAGA